MGNLSRKSELTTPPRLAVLGGAFDPIHHGHLWIIKKIPAVFSLPLLVVPNGNPPHRLASGATWEHRVNLCRLATKNLKSVTVSNMESPQQIRYTVDTIATLKKQSHQLLLFIGSDQLAVLDQWHRWQTLFSLANIVVISRSGHNIALSPAVQQFCQNRFVKKAEIQNGVGRLYMWRCSPPNIAATQIRHALTKGDSSLLLPTVHHYIQQNGLYQPAK